MHRIDGMDHVGNMFDEGDPMVPRLPTQLDKHWLNMVQEELVALPADAGIALVKGTNTQLRDALRALFVRVTGSAAQTITGIKSFTSKLIVSHVAGGAGGGGLRALIESALGEGTSSDYTTAVRNYGAGGGIDASGATKGVRGSTTSNGPTDAGVLGTGAFGGSGGYGMIAEGAQINPSRSAFRIVPQDAEPSSGQNGDVYFNATTQKLYVYAGGAWVIVGTQS